MSSKPQYKRRLRRPIRFFFRKSIGLISLKFTRLQELWELEDKISYRFCNWELLNQAFTHKSYANEVFKNMGKDYERFEFLGDSVLDTVISHLLMEKYPEANEGELSKLRSSLVNTKRLAQLARQFNLGKYLLLGKGEDQSQGRSKHSILACVYESILGAIYLDGGYKKVSKVIRSHFDSLLFSERKKVVYRDFKSLLQEYVQGPFKTVPEYNLMKESGPPHAKEFEINIRINGQTYGTGRGKNKKEAQQRAAAVTLKQLGFKAFSSFQSKTGKP